MAGAVLVLGLLWALAAAAAGSTPAAPPPVDYRIYAGLLARHVQDGVVDYAGFKKEEPLLDRFLAQLAGLDASQLSRAERFAFYINAYNAWTIKLILTAYPGVSSIKDLGSLFSSPWKKEFVHLDGQIMSLDHLEHDILRPQFADPRVHFAINCASRSCPPLRSEPYQGAKLDQQLDDQVRRFLNDPQNVRLEGNVLYVSSIFKWYGGDFRDDPLGFIQRYAQGELKERLAAPKGELEIAYLDYDWSLNGK
ncbi:MAG: DUF547 domain-containing protein [Deltaproteobacteria bacterium]|nr:DUF547 domain-containing protein [Deltaproteobacteria bacterium]